MDGAYLHVASKPLSKKTNRRIVINNETCKILTGFIQSEIGYDLDVMYYMTAEKDSQQMFRRKEFYKVLHNNGFKNDVRHFKGKQVFCPNESCQFHHSGFSHTMQAQVDVAIVMVGMKYAYKRQLESLTLLAGDTDFLDMVEFVVDEMGKSVNLVSYSDSISSNLKNHATKKGVYLELDDIWEQISEPIVDRAGSPSSDSKDAEMDKGGKKKRKKVAETRGKMSTQVSEFKPKETMSTQV